MSMQTAGEKHQLAGENAKSLTQPVVICRPFNKQWQDVFEHLNLKNLNNLKNLITLVL